MQTVLDARWFRGALAVLSLVFTAWVLVSLLFGRDDANNPVPFVVYVWLWVGMPSLSLLVGAVWPTLNPVRWLHRGVTAAARISRHAALTEVRVGYWPAAAGLFAFTWLELVAPDSTTLPVLRLAATLFVLVSVVGSLTFGERWFARWAQFTAEPDVTRTLTLLAVVLLVPGALQLAAAVSAWLSHVPTRGVAADLAPSLLPIAAGYLVAHYYSLLAFQGPRTLALLSDPLGTGENWLGTAGVTAPAGLIAPTLVAVVQAGAIVVGHLLGVVVAHERAVRVLPRRAAVVGQVPVMVLMVGYTVGGLSLLFTG